MEMINIDTFSEQLGIYDFFNVIVSGSIMGVLWYLIWPGFFEKIFLQEKIDTAVLVVLAIIISYFLGMVIQELGSILDRYVLCVKDNARKTFLRDIKSHKEYFYLQWKKNYLKYNTVIQNPVKLAMCRKYAEEILNDAGIKHGKVLSDEEIQYVCARMEYQVAYAGKDRKVEKLRALFSMARSMIICMLFGAILLLITFCKGEEHFMGISSGWWLFIIISCLGVFFYRMKKTMRYMILIMVGNYEAYYYESKRL